MTSRAETSPATACSQRLRSGPPHNSAPVPPGWPGEMTAQVREDERGASGSKAGATERALGPGPVALPVSGRRAPEVCWRQS